MPRSFFRGPLSSDLCVGAFLTQELSNMTAANCPSRETLLQYSIGMLSDEQSDELAGHLDSLSRLPGHDHDPGGRRRHADRSFADAAGERVLFGRTAVPGRLLAKAMPGACRARRRATPLGGCRRRWGNTNPGRIGPRRHGPGLQGVAHEARSGGRREGLAPRPRGRPARRSPASSAR